MTMQKQDYERIAASVRKVRDESAEQDGGVNIRAAFRELAIQLAQGFLSVNERFKVETFLVNALGSDEGQAAWQQFTERRDSNGSPRK